MADPRIDKQSKFRSREKKVASDPAGVRKYWKERRAQGRQRVGSHAWAGAKRGFGIGAGVSMAATGLTLSPSAFGEGPKAWAVRQAQQAAGGVIPTILNKAPKGTKLWHVLAAPTVAGTAIGAGSGALVGWNKGRKQWHASREHKNAVRVAHASMVGRKQQGAMTAKDYNTIIPRRVREDLIERILEDITNKEAAQKANMLRTALAVNNKTAVKNINKLLVRRHSMSAAWDGGQSSEIRKIQAALGRTGSNPSMVTGAMQHFIKHGNTPTVRHKVGKTFRYRYNRANAAESARLKKKAKEDRYWEPDTPYGNTDGYREPGGNY